MVYGLEWYYKYYTLSTDKYKVQGLGHISRISADGKEY